MIDLISIQDTKLPLMAILDGEDLADYVRRVREKELNVSLDAVVKGAQNRGFKISRGYVSQIENRYIVSPTAGKLQALAAGLGGGQRREEELFAVARGRKLKPMTPTDFASALEALGVEHYRQHGGLENLTDEDRAEIIANLEGMIEQRLIRNSKAGSKGRGKK